MKTKELNFILNKEGEVQAVELAVEGVTHCTADIRDKYNPKGITIVTSHVTAPDYDLSLGKTMGYLVECKLYSKVTIQATLLDEGMGDNGYIYTHVRHEDFENLRY